MSNSNDDGERRGVRFGPYEADFRACELRKHGLRLKIQERPLRVLQELVGRPGELVTRDELRARIWPSDIYVDFDRNLKTAVNKLRSALCDSAESPRYIETLPRRGFRFIAPVEYVDWNGAAAEAKVSDLPGGPAAEVSGPRPEPLREASEKPQPASPGNALQRWWPWAAAVLILGLLAGGAAFLRAHHQPAQAPLEFHQRDWVLISRFENLTSDPVLSGTVRYALARELSNSSFISIVSPERIQDALALMKAPANAPLTGGLARQVCLRDGGIRALITGRVEKVGNDYVLSAAIVDPSTDTQVAGAETQARNLDGILPAVHELSNQLRQTLGETLPEIQASNLNLEKVSTPSLRALQLYSQGMTFVNAQAWRNAIPLLEQATTEDRDFASAHIMLGHCYNNLDEQSMASPHFEKAFQLAGTTTERERLFILGSYYYHKHDLQNARQAYEALVRLYPDDYWGTNNLALLLVGMGKWDEAAESFARGADLLPSNFLANFRAWENLSRMGGTAQAHRYLVRAKTLLTPEIAKAHPDIQVSLESAGAESDLRDWNPQRALVETQRLAATLPAHTGEARDELVDEVGSLYMELGKLDLAGQWFGKLSPSVDYRNLDSVQLDEARGDVAGMRQAILEQYSRKEQFGAGTAIRLARLGLFGKSRHVIARIQKQQMLAMLVPLAKGGLALYEGRTSQAIPLLQEAVYGLRHFNQPQLTMGADLLATAYEQQGKVTEAIGTLQPLEEEHLLDLQTSYHLLRLYEKARDTKNAQKVEQNLLRRLAVADPDDPILVKLHRPSGLHAALTSSP